MKLLTAIIMFFMSVATLSAAPVSGDYDEGLFIAVNENEQMITGHYKNFGGWDARTNSPRFECSFYLYGTLNADSSIALSTWSPSDGKPEIINGTLDFSDQQGGLSIKLESEHGGCWNVQHFADDHQQASFSYPSKTNWIEIRIARSDKIYFHRELSANSKRKAYVIKGDLLKVFAKTPGWLYVEYQSNSGSTTQGWVNEADVYPSHPNVATGFIGVK